LNFKKEFGLLKLQENLKKKKTEKSVLANGIDLTMFGLNLNSTEEYLNH